MPQLDFIIILPQIFWLVIFFILTYFILTYFFLPYFLKTVLARTKFIAYSYTFERRLSEEVFKKRQVISKNLNLSFNDLYSHLFSRILISKFNFLEKPFKSNYLLVNKKIFNIFKKTLHFCSPVVLDSIKFYPSFLNKKI